MRIFGSYLPGAQEKDFYELDIASGSITRGFMAKHCDMYFTMEQKLRRYLTCCFKIYDVPEREYAPVIEQTLKVDLRSIADTIQKAENGFESVMGEQ